MCYINQEEFMGMVYTEIKLSNLYDVGFAKRGHLKPENVRTVTVSAVADTGAMHLVITEELRQQLGLGIEGEKTVAIANGQRVTSQITEAVEVQWKNRNMVIPALVIPGANTVLLGALALEGMDLMVNPTTQEVVGAHGDEEEFYAL
jgi:clan AA aspartic protease